MRNFDRLHNSTYHKSPKKAPQKGDYSQLILDVISTWTDTSKEERFQGDRFQVDRYSVSLHGPKERVKKTGMAFVSLFIQNQADSPNRFCGSNWPVMQPSMPYGYKKSNLGLSISFSCDLT